MYNAWWEILLSIIGGIAVTLLLAMFSPLKKLVLKLFRKDIGVHKYTNRKKETVFQLKDFVNLRISVSVLASIEKEEKFLLMSKNPDSERQDSVFKPLGGVVKMNENIKKIIGFKYTPDKKTRYSAKGEDFRIFMDSKSTKKINKAIYSNGIDYYKDQLIREVMEELIISRDKFDSLFIFTEKQPQGVFPIYIEKDISVLDEHDYVCHIVFKLSIKDEKKLAKLLEERRKVKFISLNGKENKAITSFLIARRKEFRHFKYLDDE